MARTFVRLNAAMKRKLIASLLAALTFFSSAGFAQQPAEAPAAVRKQNAAVKTFGLKSKLMGREMPYNVVLPPGYETEKQSRFPVLYLLHGLSGSYQDWAKRTKLIEYAAERRLIVVNPEGGDGFYTDSATQPNAKYESYIVQELIPEIDKNFRTVAERRGRAIAGLSMGGYGALKFGVKYPESFALAASMSGAVAAASYRTTDELPVSDWLKKPILAAFGAPENQTRKENDLFKIFGELPPEKIAASPFFYLDCGIEDQLKLLEPNQRLAQILVARKIPHEFRQLPGKHGWDYWNRQVEEVLRLSDRIFAPK